VIARVEGPTRLSIFSSALSDAAAKYLKNGAVAAVRLNRFPSTRSLRGKTARLERGRRCRERLAAGPTRRHAVSTVQGRCSRCARVDPSDRSPRGYPRHARCPDTSCCPSKSRRPSRRFTARANPSTPTPTPAPAFAA
jgi:hypothetical protein